MRLKALFLCLLFGSMAAPSLAVTTKVTPASDLVGTIGAAASGDVIVLAEGTYNVSSPIQVPSGVTIQSFDKYPDNTHIVFNLAGGDTSSYGFVLAANATGVTITDLDIVSNHGIVQWSAGGSYSNITISHNNLQYGGGTLSDGTLVFGLSGTDPVQYLQVVHNYFHDTQGSIRNWSIWYASDSSFDYNEFYNINDGGQLDMPGANVSFSYNYGTYIHRMGQEVALNAQSTFKCIGNVFYDYVLPYNDTEGVSIIGVSSTVIISNNYFKADIAPGSTWGQPDAGGINRFGYAIEATGDSSSYVSNNTLVGPWADFVSSDIPNLLVEGNAVYGVSRWGAFDGEPGPDGYGSIQYATPDTNTYDLNANDAPPVPPDTFGAGVSGTEPSTYGVSGSNSGSTASSGSTDSGTGSTVAQSTGNTPPATQPTDTSAAASLPPLPLTGVRISVTSATTATVTWNSPNPDIVSVTINMISTIGRQNFPPQTQQGASTTMNVTALHPGWLIDFTVVATGSNGQVYESKPITALTPGNSLAPWAGILWGGISTIKTDPYTY